MEKSNLEGFPKVISTRVCVLRLTVDFKATKGGVAEAGKGFAKIASKVKSEEENTVILKKEE